MNEKFTFWGIHRIHIVPTYVADYQNILCNTQQRTRCRSLVRHCSHLFLNIKIANILVQMVSQISYTIYIFVQFSFHTISPTSIFHSIKIQWAEFYEASIEILVHPHCMHFDASCTALSLISKIQKYGSVWEKVFIDKIHDTNSEKCPFLLQAIPHFLYHRRSKHNKNNTTMQCNLLQTFCKSYFQRNGNEKKNYEYGHNIHNN